MLVHYLQIALERAHYEIIKDAEPYYGQVPGLDGLWATGATLESCRNNLAEAVEDWLLFSITQGLSVPALGDVSIQIPQKAAA